MQNTCLCIAISIVHGTLYVANTRTIHRSERQGTLYLVILCSNMAVKMLNKILLNRNNMFNLACIIETTHYDRNENHFIVNKY